MYRQAEREDQLIFLREKAKLLRRYILKMIANAKSGHPGGSLSAVEIVTALYYKIMRIDLKNPEWENRDRFILSKGHACPVVYAALADLGYISISDLKELRQVGKLLQGHPSIKTPGIDMATGSLGQGLSIANGMALGGKINDKNYRVYALLGDGELQEGQIWEAVMTAYHNKLDNLTVFVDYNKLQLDGSCAALKSLGGLLEKWRAFGWNAIEIDGHDFEQILSAITIAIKTRNVPTVIIANTIKGKGVSFMENEVSWHGGAPDENQLRIALNDIGGEDAWL
ncbi:MAG: transketolase [Bacillota bacterium]